MNETMKEHLEDLIVQMVNSGMRYESTGPFFEKIYIRQVLRRVKGNQSRAASLLGMHRNTLARKIGEHGLSVEQEIEQVEPLRSTKLDPRHFFLNEQHELPRVARRS